MGAIISVISSYTFSQVIFLMIVLFLLYIVYIKMTDDDYYTELHRIKKEHETRIWIYVSDELRVIEDQSLSRVRELLGINGSFDPSSDKEKEYAMFSLVLERSLYHTVFTSIKNAVKLNGFHELKDEQLDRYIADKSNVILRESRKSVSHKEMYFPTLRGTDEQRYSANDAEKFFKKVVDKAIYESNQEKLAIKKLKKKYSLWTKINFVGAILNKLKKVSD